MNGFIDVSECEIFGDGKTLNTNRIQCLIDECSRKGGGVLFFPSGVYMTGTLELKNKTTLYLSQGAVIRGSVNMDDYKGDVEKYVDGCGVERGHALIYANRVSNITIEGDGTIDGNGRDDNFSYKRPRPILLRFFECQKVKVKDVTLRDSVAWVQHYARCDDVRIEGVRVDSWNYSNNDGLNIDGCHRVRIFNCDIRSEDDALTLKSTSTRACEDITITNCVLSTYCNGIKFGTETIGGFENITINNIAINGTGRSGINISTIDGAKLENIIISNIVMRDVVHSIFMRLGGRNYQLPEKAERKPGTLKNVIIQNVHSVETASKDHLMFDTFNKERLSSVGSAILGYSQENPIENLTLENINITSLGGGTRDDANPDVPELPTAYSQYTDWKRRFPAYGLFCRHVRGLKIDNCSFKTIAKDERSLLRFEDVEDFTVSDVRGATPSESSPPIGLDKVKSGVFSGINLAGTALEDLLPAEMRRENRMSFAY